MEIKEEWKKLPEYKEMQISSLGRVKRFTGKSKGTIRSEFCEDKDGYYKCSVQKKDGTWTQQYLHRLVAMAFIPNPNNKPCVNHIDANRKNNAASNLEWVTVKENTIHSFLHGKRKKCKIVPKETVLTDY